jgi:hypothetical protein
MKQRRQRRGGVAGARGGSEHGLTSGGAVLIANTHPVIVGLTGIGSVCGAIAHIRQVGSVGRITQIVQGIVAGVHRAMEKSVVLLMGCDGRCCWSSRLWRIVTIYPAKANFALFW